jgi:hypothetical protein
MKDEKERAVGFIPSSSPPLRPLTLIIPFHSSRGILNARLRRDVAVRVSPFSTGMHHAPK